MDSKLCNIIKIEKLPIELIWYMMQFLPYPDLLNFILGTKKEYFQEIFLKNFFWKEKFEYIFRPFIPFLKENSEFVEKNEEIEKNISEKIKVNKDLFNNLRTDPKSPYSTLKDDQNEGYVIYTYFIYDKALPKMGINEGKITKYQTIVTLGFPNPLIVKEEEDYDVNIESLKFFLTLPSREMNIKHIGTFKENEHIIREFYKDDLLFDFLYKKCYLKYLKEEDENTSWKKIVSTMNYYFRQLNLYEDIPLHMTREEVLFKGYWIRNGYQGDMETYLYFYKDGNITGRGKDEVGHFIWIVDKDEKLKEKKNENEKEKNKKKKVNLIHLKKIYPTQHLIKYVGTMYIENGLRVFKGNWTILRNNKGEFLLKEVSYDKHCRT